MRALLVLTLLALVAPALAQVGDQRDLLVRDRSGRVIERLEPGRYDTWARRDSRGNYLGSAETDRTGRVILKAPGGRVQGTVEPAPGQSRDIPTRR